MCLSILDEIVGGDVDGGAVVLQVADAVAPGQEADGEGGQVQLRASPEEHGADALFLAVPGVHVREATTEL